MKLSRTDLVVPMLAIVAGGVIGLSLSLNFLGSRSDDVPAPERPAPERPVPERPVPERPVPERPVPERPVPVVQSSVFDECTDDRAYRLLGWADKCADVLVDGFDEEADLSAAPVFTPMTVRPEIRNRSEVQAALIKEYPAILRDAGIGGTAVVWFFVSEEGTVLNRRVSESSGHTPLDEAALKVADVFRFTPALNREKIVPVWIQLPITFQVQ